MTIRIHVTCAAIAIAFASTSFAQAPAAKPIRIRGDIVSVSGDTMMVHRNGGDTVAVELKPEATVSALRYVELEDIKAGTFIGTAATPGADGKLSAREVVVFPEAARGTGEGHYDWDLGTNSTMTNANVDTVVEATNGRQLQLSYKGGSKTVVVPVGTPVVTVIPATRADLVAGKKVFLAAMPLEAGRYSAQRVVVEKNGVVPPM